MFHCCNGAFILCCYLSVAFLSSSILFLYSGMIKFKMVYILLISFFSGQCHGCRFKWSICTVSWVSEYISCVEVRLGVKESVANI